MTKEDFAQLRAGDVVVYNGKRLRTVQEGPADKGRKCNCPASKPACGHMCVVFSILRRSWTKRIKTVYDWNSIGHLLEPTTERNKALFKSEYLALKGTGLNIRAGLKRELIEAARLAGITGRPLCKAYGRLWKLGESA